MDKQLVTQCVVVCIGGPAIGFVVASAIVDLTTFSQSAKARAFDRRKR